MTHEHMCLFHEGVKFEDQVVYMSGNSYIDCEFHRCTLVVRDLLVPQASNCRLIACNWHLDMLVTDHNIWKGFLEGLGKVILDSLPRAIGDKQ